MAGTQKSEMESGIGNFHCKYTKLFAWIFFKLFV